MAGPACMPLVSVPQPLMERQAALRACPLSIVLYMQQPSPTPPSQSMAPPAAGAAADAAPAASPPPPPVGDGTRAGSGVPPPPPLPVCATASLINNAPLEPLYGWQVVWSWPQRGTLAAADVQGAVLITNGKRGL